MNTTIRDKARKLLAERPANLTYNEIGVETGIGVDWLSAFARGTIKNPGVNTVERLTTFLENYKK